MKPLALFVLCALAAPAAADPCDDAAARVLARYPTYATYCAACGDRAPGAPAMWHAGDVVDVAHAYVQTSPVRFTNLADLAGCARDAGPANLHVASETATGVLITADDRDEPAPPAAPIVLTAPARVHADDESDAQVWLVIGLVGSTELLLLASLFALVRWRKRAHVPRAVELAHRIGSTNEKCS